MHLNRLPTEQRIAPFLCNPVPTLGSQSAPLFCFPLLQAFSCVVVRFKNGQGSTLHGGNYIVHENGTLEIIRARKEDQGTYTCVATNLLGKAQNQVRLEIKGKMASV